MLEKNALRIVGGMTLLELLVVIAIISALASIAYPSYTQYIRKSHRQQAISDMNRLQLYLESHFQNGYDIESVSANGLCTDFCEVNRKRYKISIAAMDAGYTIKALPLGELGQNQDQCGGESYSALMLNHLGEMTPKSCW
ncbi:type IV pilin protein [Vibrio sinus]|uniref:type IV pilin protein n=1 Tax=Vibrio sinus TaxID=2946865 RepID=UPI002543A6A9|nr:type IV pilin protein [Vibrio sinus]